jgi:16S rRNA (guanine527-N7)-methyltransferase
MTTEPAKSSEAASESPDLVARLSAAGGRLAELRASYGLSVDQVDQLRALLKLLALDRRAPTTISEPGQAVDVHLADSLIALEIAAVREARKIADIGSGAGFPGLPLAIALPSMELSVVESQSRKCRFLCDLSACIPVANARIVCSRVEDWTAGFGSQDVVTARALAAQPVVLEYAAPLLRLGGLLVDWRGGRDQREETAAALAAEQLGLELVEIRRAEPFLGAIQHYLHLYLKVNDTPDRFPRRAGIARKRPLAS